MKKTISKEEINALPLATFQGDIITVNKPNECSDAIEELRKEAYIGFDTETRPSFTKNKSYKVSLLQLSTPNKVFLFRLKNLGLPRNLSDLLNDPSHFKIGLALNQDIKSLQELTPFKARSFIDLQTLAKKIKSDLKSPTENQNLFDEINKTEEYMNEKFSKSLHPEILSELTSSIQVSTDNLKRLGQNSEQKTKETIEKEALLYKELRELMSTKEFVEQYETGIKDD